MTETLAAEAGDVVVSGHRARSLPETARLARSWMERCGVTRIADVTELDVVGIPVYHSVRPSAAPGLNTVTSGKGTTAQAAWVSAALEAIERTYCEPAGRATVTETYERLRRTGPVLDPRRLVLRRGHQWRPDLELAWYPMRELHRDVTVAVPAVSVFTPFPDHHGMLRSNTIGLASGNSREEALLHALYEVVEHDCTAFAEVLRMGWRVDVDTLPDSAQALVERFRRAAIDVSVFAYDSGFGLYSFYVTAEDTHAQDAMLINGGAGCSLDPVVAVHRALTEAAQSRLAVIGGSREDLDTQAYRRHSSYAAMKDIFDAWSRFPRPVLSFADIPDLSTGSTAGDLDAVRRRLVDGGLDLLLTAELSPPDSPFSVVKAVVPGIEFTHVDPRRCGARMTRALRASELRDTGSEEVPC
ncbi:YcaO-like family protein [Paractinoplanes lichenicola]|uniref:YcaO-like family protein n=1 Tax=Paractinoplanes lichenicola TaxID=2802976 RepID=A0ABS1VMS4_9ACTN|nr:YcaO-like family protein [Actinoplanes lichenicola]MBL7256031.1 YcaO-like family protein [Actinoplanes lichenicola]